MCHTCTLFVFLLFTPSPPAYSLNSLPFFPACCSAVCAQSPLLPPSRLLASLPACGARQLSHSLPTSLCCALMVSGFIHSCCNSSPRHPVACPPCCFAACPVCCTLPPLFLSEAFCRERSCPLAGRFTISGPLSFLLCSMTSVDCEGPPACQPATARRPNLASALCGAVCGLVTARRPLQSNPQPSRQRRWRQQAAAVLP